MKQRYRVSVSISVLLGALILLHLRSAGEAVPIRKPLDAFPNAFGAWTGREGAVFDREIQSMLRATDYTLRRYQAGDGRSLWLFVGYWQSQRKGAQPHSPKNCLPGAGWEPLDWSALTIEVPTRHGAITVNKYLIQKDRERQVVIYWYQSQGQPIASELTARLSMMKSAVLRHRTDGALVRISSPVVGDERESTDRLVAFVREIYPVLGEYLPD